MEIELTELMDMETVEAWSEAGHLGGDLDLLALGLDELGPAVDARVAVFLEHADCVVSCSAVDHLEIFVFF